MLEKCRHPFGFMYLWGQVRTQVESHFTTMFMSC
jgi:hypothetical protein